MYAITRSLIRSSALRQGVQTMQANQARQVGMKIVPVAAEKLETYDEKNMRLGREMSPHISIYKFPFPAVLSISHRGTGIALTTYTWALGLGALATSHDVSHYVTMLEGLHMNSVTLTALKFILAFPLTYHTCAGIRHLIWDTGSLLKMKEVYSTGYVTIATALALAVGLALL